MLVVDASVLAVALADDATDGDRARARLQGETSQRQTDNLTVYDAAYVALAEAVESPLLTADARLAKSTGPRCLIEVLR